MTAPAYTTGLSSQTITDCESATFTEPTGFTDGAVTNGETDYFIQGAKCTSKSMGASAGATSGVIFDYLSNISLGATDVVMIWVFFGAPNALETLANGGLRLFAGSGTGAFRHWYILGSDIYTYGGWRCIPVYVQDTTYDNTTGSPAGTWRYFGAGAVLKSTSSVSKGNPLGVDAIRYGRAEARFNYGSSGDGYCTIAGFAAQNDSQSNRWGLIQAIDGGYLWQGKMTIGYSAACEFVDANRNIFIADTRKVQSDFNAIVIQTNSTVVDWTNFSFICVAPSTTASKGSLSVSTDTLTVSMTGCQFTDMGAFTFRSTCTLGTTTFRRCDQVTGNGATFNACAFNNATAAYSVAVADLAKLNGCSFISDGSNTAVYFTGTAGTYDWNCTATGYDTGSSGDAVQRTGGSITGNEHIYVTASAGTFTISVAAGATTPSVASAGAIVNVSSGTVNVKAKAVTESGAAVSGARLYLEAADDTGPFPYYESVSIANSGTTATVTHTGHGMATNDKVCIRGASHNQNNGVFQITKLSADSYSYTMAAAPGSSPTGTITATFVALADVSDSTGYNTTSVSRVYPDDQPVLGRIRKSTSSPLYKSAALSGTIYAATGGDFVGVLISDE